MKKSMFYRSLGLVLAVNLVAQSGFVSMAADNSSSEISTLEEENVTVSEDETITDSEDENVTVFEDEEIIAIEESEDTSDDVSDEASEVASYDVSANDVETYTEETSTSIAEEIGDDTLDGEAQLLGGDVTPNMSWDYNGGTLTIKGSGSMPDYSIHGAPWDAYRTSITKVVFSGSVKNIGKYTFRDCTALKEVVLCEGLTIIDQQAFYNTALGKLTLPDSVKEIGQEAFSHCKLTEITIPKNVSILGLKAFSSNNSLFKVDIKTKVLNSVGYQVFYDCAVNKIVFPEGIKTIPDFLFYNANFNNCSITIPKTVTTIGHHAFSNTDSTAKGISSLKFEEGSVLTEIGAAAFEDSYFDSLVLPESVKSIGGCAFARTEISEIAIPSKVTKIEYSAFNHCKNLKKVVIKTTGLTEVGSSIFEGCAINVVQFPQGITSIPNNIFYNAKFVNCSITIPASVTTIGHNAFLAESIASSGISELNFEKGSKLTSIGKFAFRNTPIDTLVLPENLKEIGDNAFSKTNISEVVIPSKVTTIGDNAFGDCKFLTKVTLPASVKKIDYHAFHITGSRQITFYVKPGTYAYEWVKKAAANFKYTISVAYDIAYVLNGGVNNSKNPAVYEKDDYITLYAPTRSSYSFKGWFLDKAFKKSADQVDTSKGNKLIFYAKWEANTYIVKLDANGGSITSGESKIQVKYAAKYPKPLATATRNGFTFAGWYTLALGGTKVTGGSTVFKPENPDNATLFAHWTPVKYKITYQLDGGSLKKKKPTTYTMNEDAELPVPTRTGYSFGGWQVVSSTGKTAVAAGSTIAGGRGNYGNVVLKATWKENVYKLVIHENKKDAADRTCSPDGLYTYEQAVNMFDVATLLKDKCGTSETEKIASFNTKANGKGKKYALGKDYSRLSVGSSRGASPVATLDLYAQWGKTSTYRITYDLSGGTLAGPVNSYNSDKAVKLPAPKKKGYKFTGWEVTAPSTVTVTVKGTTTTIVKGSKGKIHVKAKFQPVK
jgi:uncharacterized repeat protein (TIGR02543 family)